MAELSQILQVAKDILQDYGQKGLHVAELTEIAIKQNKNMGLCAEDFQKKVQSALAANLKLKSKSPTFSQVNHDKGIRKGKPKQGWYRVKRSIKPDPSPINIPQDPNISTQFLGKAGEYAVMSELLFHGFNTSIMTVDDGIDLVANKKEKFFKIQVKTAKRQESGKYQFSINKTSYERYNSADVYYALALRTQNKNEYFIVPQSQLDYFIQSQVIQVGTDKISFTINYDERNKKYLLNNKADIQPFYANFGGIK